MQDITTNIIGISGDLGKPIEATSKALPKTISKFDALTSGVLEIITTPVEICLYFKTNFKKKIETIFSAKYANIPPNKRINPPPQVLSAINNAAEVCADNEHIQEMFAELLAKACNKDYVEKIHPAFIDKVKQLSPLEASLIINTDLLKKDMPYCMIRYQQYPNKDFLIKSNEAFFQQICPGNTPMSIYLVIPNFTNNLTDWYRLSEAVDNIKTLGLIELTVNLSLTAEHTYDAFTETDYFKELISGPLQNQQKVDEPFKRGFFLIKGIISPTNFGRAFYKTICQ